MPGNQNERAGHGGRHALVRAFWSKGTDTKKRVGGGRRAPKRTSVDTGSDSSSIVARREENKIEEGPRMKNNLLITQNIETNNKGHVCRDCYFDHFHLMEIYKAVIFHSYSDLK
eukprot:340966_1